MPVRNPKSMWSNSPVVALISLALAGCSEAEAGSKLKDTSSQAELEIPATGLVNANPTLLSWPSLPQGRSSLSSDLAVVDDDRPAIFAQVERDGMRVTASVVTPELREEACYSGVIGAKGLLSEGRYMDVVNGGDDGVQSEQSFTDATMEQLFGQSLLSTGTDRNVLCSARWMPRFCSILFKSSVQAQPGLTLYAPLG